MLHFAQHYGMWVTGSLLTLVGLWQVVKAQDPDSEAEKRAKMLDRLNEHYAEQ